MFDAKKKLSTYTLIMLVLFSDYQMRILEFLLSNLKPISL